MNPDNAASLSFRLRPLAVVCVLIVLAASTCPRVGSAQRARPQAAFQGTWAMEASTRVLDLAAGRRVLTYEMTGDLKLVLADGAVVSFMSRCLGLSDSETGNIGRCIWLDRDGHQVFSEVSGRKIRDSGRSEAIIVGGNGKYEGMTGRYELTWIALRSPTTGVLEASSVNMTGSWVAPAPRRGRGVHP